MYDVRLIRCKRTDQRYSEIRDRHYIPNNGAFGQQIHYLIEMNGAAGGLIVGIISGGSAAYSVGCRDKFFGITKENRNVALNSIVDNTVFRLEKNLPNLGTQILAIWRRQVAKDWKGAYGVDVAGFETFIIENSRRKGALYLADNWTYVGETAGSSKTHHHGMGNPFERAQVCKKMVFCKWVKGGKLATEYTPVWNRPGMIRGQISMFDENTFKGGLIL